jgi:hypothetical protein
MVNGESSDRGLSPHKFMPMLGVHKTFQRTRKERATLNLVVSPLLGILGNTLLNGSDLLLLDQAILTR